MDNSTFIKNIQMSPTNYSDIAQLLVWIEQRNNAILEVSKHPDSDQFKFDYIEYCNKQIKLILQL